MPAEDPTSVTVTDTEQDIFDGIENGFDRCTVFVNNADATGSITVKFWGKPRLGDSVDWWLISANDMEPATATIFVCPDLYADFKVSSVRKTTKNAAGVVFNMVWEASIKPGRVVRQTRAEKES